MTLKAERAVGEKTTCFYSIKLGGAESKDLRDYCIKNNMIAISFGMTQQRHHALVSVLQDEIKLDKSLKSAGFDKKNKTYKINQHKYFYRPDTNAVWITVHNGHVYYSEEIAEITESSFIFEAFRPDKNPDKYKAWIYRKIGGWKPLPTPITKLPGRIQNLNVQRHTILVIQSSSKDKEEKFELLRNVINQEKPEVEKYKIKYGDRAESIAGLIQKLGSKDFELLVDLILYRMAYVRESTLGEQEKDFDGIYRDLRNTAKYLYVQTKCQTDITEKDQFVQTFREILDGQGELDRQYEGLFVYHTMSGKVQASDNSHVAEHAEVWSITEVAQHVINLGLESWILDRVYA